MREQHDAGGILRRHEIALHLRTTHGNLDPPLGRVRGWYVHHDLTSRPVPLTLATDLTPPKYAQVCSRWPATLGDMQRHSRTIACVARTYPPILSPFYSPGLRSGKKRQHQPV